MNYEEGCNYYTLYWNLTCQATVQRKGVFDCRIRIETHLHNIEKCIEEIFFEKGAQKTDAARAYIYLAT